MRKLSLFGIIFVLSATRLCFAAAPFHIELYGETQDKGKNQTCGTRISLPFAEVRFTTREEKKNYGISLTTRNLVKQAPVEIKYGNLSFSGSLTKLNSPELSNGTSPFSSSILSPLCISASLPGYSSFSKEESYFFQAKLNKINKSPFSFTINMALLPEYSYPIFSTLISNKFFSNQLSLSAACTAGKFLFEGNDSSSWLLTSPYYVGGEIFASLLQLSAGFKGKTTGNSIQTSFMTAFYESPFGPYTNVYRADLKLSLNHLDFFTSAFLNSYKETLTSSEKMLNPDSQFKAGFVTKTPFLSKKSNLWFIKFGLNAYTKINFTENLHPLRINTGLQFSSDITSIALSLSADAKMISENPDTNLQSLEKNDITFQIKNTWYFKSFNPALALTVNKNNYRLTINVSNNSQQRINGNCILNISTKENKIEKKLTASLTCRFKVRTITFIGKLSATLE